LNVGSSSSRPAVSSRSGPAKKPSREHRHQHDEPTLAGCHHPARVIGRTTAVRRPSRGRIRPSSWVPPAALKMSQRQAGRLSAGKSGCGSFGRQVTWPSNRAPSPSRTAERDVAGRVRAGAVSFPLTPCSYTAPTTGPPPRVLHHPAFDEEALHGVGAVGPAMIASPVQAQTVAHQIHVRCHDS